MKNDYRELMKYAQAIFTHCQAQGMEHYFSGNCFKDLETANKYLSDYAFLLKDRFVKSIGISGGKII